MFIFPMRICSADKIKLITAQQNGLMHEPNSGVALVRIELGTRRQCYQCQGCQ